MIKFAVRWAFRLFILLVVFAVALILLKDTILKGVIENQIRNQGMDVRMGRLELGLLSPTLTVQDLKIYNGGEFGGAPFVEVPDLYLEYDPGALLWRRLHLRLVRLVVTELDVVESRSGQTNLVLALPDSSGGRPFGRRREPTIFGFDFKGIDTLNLSLGRVKYVSLKRPDSNTEISLELKNQLFQNIKSLSELSEVVMRQLLHNGITITTESPSTQRQRPARRALESPRR